MPDKSPPAFAHGNREQGGDPGMSLRDYFAGQALASFESCDTLPAKQVAEYCYEVANAMLAEREKSNAN